MCFSWWIDSEYLIVYIPQVNIKRAVVATFKCNRFFCLYFNFLGNWAADDHCRFCSVVIVWKILGLWIRWLAYRKENNKASKKYGCDIKSRWRSMAEQSCRYVYVSYLGGKCITFCYWFQHQDINKNNFLLSLSLIFSACKYSGFVFFIEKSQVPHGYSEGGFVFVGLQFLAGLQLLLSNVLGVLTWDREIIRDNAIIKLNLLRFLGIFHCKKGLQSLSREVSRWHIKSSLIN